MSSLPDKIFTTGKIPKDIMAYYGDYPPSQVEPSCGLRFEYLFNHKNSPDIISGLFLFSLAFIRGHRPMDECPPRRADRREKT